MLDIEYMLCLGVVLDAVGIQRSFSSRLFSPVSLAITFVHVIHVPLNLVVCCGSNEKQLPLKYLVYFYHLSQKTDVSKPDRFY